MRDLIKKILREDDWDWVREIDPMKKIKDFFTVKGQLDTVELLYSYARIKHKKEGVYRLFYSIMGYRNFTQDEIDLFRSALIKFIKENTSTIKRFMAKMSYDDTRYDQEDFIDDLYRRLVKESEEDDGLDWIRDIQPIKAGDVYHIYHTGRPWDPDTEIYENPRYILTITMVTNDSVHYNRESYTETTPIITRGKTLSLDIVQRMITDGYWQKQN